MPLSVERSLQGSFGPITSPPTITSTTVGTTAQVLITDSTAAHNGVREVSVINTHGSQSVAILFFTAGATVTGGTFAQGWPILPGSSQTFTVQANLRLAIIGSGASTSYVVMVNDK